MIVRQTFHINMITITLRAPFESWDRLVGNFDLDPSAVSLACKVLKNLQTAVVVCPQLPILAWCYLHHRDVALLQITVSQHGFGVIYMGTISKRRAARALTELYATWVYEGSLRLTTFSSRFAVSFR
eukprot:TRINITY_DN3526_c0_g1_i1.p2 TRINITY_DN3526_c0_g1~~TRINITY_DN3526_c0_g1_i1.p2  ORF type:complete len:127 (-),score=6.76 TRINITY_DN3526_c0_g1_i1:430-810(-)